MCGRYSQQEPVIELSEFLQAPIIGAAVPGPNWQVRPTDPVPIALESAKTPGRRLEGARWDLARPRQETLKHPGPPLINVRVETALEKFSWATRQRRCLVPASGYWEWTGSGRGNKQPHYFHLTQAPMVFAGVYSWWRDPAPADEASAWTLTAAMLTIDADARLGRIHDRTPLLLPADAWDSWLDPTIIGDEALMAYVEDAHRRLVQGVQVHPVRPFPPTAQGPEITIPIDESF